MEVLGERMFSAAESGRETVWYGWNIRIVDAYTTSTTDFWVGLTRSPSIRLRGSPEQYFLHQLLVMGILVDLPSGVKWDLAKFLKVACI